MSTVAIIPNVAAGRINEFARKVNGNDPANSAFIVILCEVGDSIANLRDFDDVAALLAGASTESAFTNYTRTVLDDADIVDPAVDDTGDEQTWEVADQSPLIASAGGATDQDIDMVIIAYDPDTIGGTDSALIPVHITLDNAAAALQTTNGSDLDLTSPTPTWSAADSTA